MKFFIVALALHGLAKTFDCPSKLSGASQNVGPWKIVTIDPKTQSPEKYKGVAVYDGPPQEMASLVPDIDNTPPKPSTWELDSSSDRYWLACLYKNTETKYAMNLSPGFAKCSSFDKHGKGGFVCSVASPRK